MEEKNNQTVCGIVCDECNHFGENCIGCKDVYGRPFWLEFSNAEICPVYDCCINEKGYEHCGKCSEFMCEKFTRYRDPEIGDEDLEDFLEKMKENLMTRE